MAIEAQLDESFNAAPAITNSAKAADCEVAIIGAGPYGLSAAAHLNAMGVDVRIFGQPMEFWGSKMPAGMLLRSPREASNISDHAYSATLDTYESSAGLPQKAPIPIETFVDYGRWFQQQMVPQLDRREVASVERDQSSFLVSLKGGESLRAKRVIVAAGIGSFSRVPRIFSELPSTQCSHCYGGFDVSSFAQKRVTVIGAGQSALESAALLHENGAEVEIIARIPELRWIGMHGWLHHLGPISSMLYSKHDIGPLGISRLVAMPHLVKRIPLKLRDKLRKRAVRSAGSNWLPARLAKVKVTAERAVTGALASGSELILTLNDGTKRNTDHVLLGTGYDVNIARYEFLPESLLKQIHIRDGYPHIGAGFSSSIEGLHFVGAPAARSLGPLFYFVTGTEFTSRNLSSYILRNRKKANR